MKSSLVLGTKLNKIAHIAYFTLGLLTLCEVCIMSLPTSTILWHFLYDLELIHWKITKKYNCQRHTERWNWIKIWEIILSNIVKKIHLQTILFPFHYGSWLERLYIPYNYTLTACFGSSVEIIIGKACNHFTTKAHFRNQFEWFTGFHAGLRHFLGIYSRFAFDVCSSDNTRCSGGALVYHSNQDPTYTDGHGAPHRCAASTMWQAVTPEPQDPQRGFFRSTPDSSNNFFSSPGGRNMPSLSRKLKKGMHVEPGMWPGWTPARQGQSHRASITV